jgi:hypothetical protein
MGTPHPLQGCGVGVGALVALWNRFHVFVGELESLTPRVRYSNR